MKSIEIDRSKSLVEEPHKGHNRFHPDIPPVLEVDEGEEVVFETRESSDRQVTPERTEEEMARRDSRRVHPLTGPAYVKGARPGDLLEVEFLSIAPARWGYTSATPGRGYLPEAAATRLVAFWDIRDGFATTAQVPGVRVPAAPFMGIAAVSPSHAQVRAWAQREAAAAARGGSVQPPDPGSAVPATGAPATEGLRTIPPRENGGNMDIKHTAAGTRLLLPVFVDGTLFSTGDGHFAQGDGEVCINAVEMDATVAVRFRVLPGEAERKGIRGPRFVRESYFTDPRWAVPQRFTATVGLSLGEQGGAAQDLNAACRHALEQMLDLLQERGYTREQAYIICSVAVDLHVSQVVNNPTFTVTAMLPEDIFEG